MTALHPLDKPLRGGTLEYHRTIGGCLAHWKITGPLAARPWPAGGCLARWEIPPSRKHPECKHTWKHWFMMLVLVRVLVLGSLSMWASWLAWHANGYGAVKG